MCINNEHKNKELLTLKKHIKLYILVKIYYRLTAFTIFKL